MLYTCVDDFFNHVEEIKKTKKTLSREEEKELAQKMKVGQDEVSYLFDMFL